jgi:hypothetical protein
MDTYLNGIHKFVIDIVRLHLLANKIGHTSKQRIDRGDLAIPSNQRRNSSAVDTGRFSTSIDVLVVAVSISIRPKVHGKRNSLSIFFATTMFLHQARPTDLLNRIVGNTLYGVMTSSS